MILLRVRGERMKLNSGLAEYLSIVIPPGSMVDVDLGGLAKGSLRLWGVW
jgi:hypothetical protein